LEKNDISPDVSVGEPTCLTKIRISPRIKEVIQTSIDAYFNDKMAGRNPQYGPLALIGPSGTGKSLVARSVGGALGLNINSINGHSLTGHNLYSFFLDANETTTCLHIDEAQGIAKPIQERILTIISEGYIEVPTVIMKKIRKMPVPKCPIIFSAMTEHSLIPALRNRIRLYCRFDYYLTEDLIEITRQRALALKWSIESDAVLQQICFRAKKTPRLALRNLQLCWNVTRSLDLDMITAEHADRAFKLSDVDEIGLDHLERSYLRILSEESPLALNVIASRLSGGGIEVQTIKNVIEPYLIQERLITKNGSLRQITDNGIWHLENTNF
jgi:Holliday junction DNA helicase RuvB